MICFFAVQKELYDEYIENGNNKEGLDNIIKIVETMKKRNYVVYF